MSESNANLYYYDEEEVQYATPEEMKAEAIRRMKKLRYYKPSIQLFEEEGVVMLNEPPMYAHYILDEYNSSESYEILKPVMDMLQKDNKRLVYAVIMSFSNLGKTFEFLYVDRYKEEWQMFDSDLDLFGNTFAYVYNSTHPDCSEYGSIGIQLSPAAGIARTA